MWWRRSWFSLKGKAGIPGQTEGCPATSIGPRVPPVGSLQQRVENDIIERRPTFNGEQVESWVIYPSALVGHSVRSSVLCGPVSCREVDHVATTNESVARLECGGADGVDAVEPVAAYAGGSGRAGGGVAGGCRRAELHSRRAGGRAPR